MALVKAASPRVLPYWAVRNEVLPSLPRFSNKERGPCLAVSDLTVSFKGIKAVDHLSMEVQHGEIHALVGPNGAGKSTVLNCICGLYKPDEGVIGFRGEDLVGKPPHTIADYGVGRTFQRLALFDGMTVLDNLMLSRHRFNRTGIVAGAFFWGRALRQETRHRAVVEEIIKFLELEGLRDKRAGELTYGQQKRVEIGRALAVEPQLLLLDEPVAGMNREEKEAVARYILDVKEELGVTVVLIEHELDMVLSISDRVTVVNFGSVVATDTPSRIIENPAVLAAYIGSGGGS